MVAAVPDLPAAADHGVQAAREGDGEPSDAGTQIVALDDEVQVVALDREVKDAETRAVGLLPLADEDATNELHSALRPERLDDVLRAQRHVHRVARIVSGARKVADTWPRAG